MAQFSTTSADGRYTIIHDEDFRYSSEWSDAPEGHQRVDLLDNITGKSVNLYSYSGTGNEVGRVIFSPDNKYVVFAIQGGWDWSGYSNKYSFRAVNLETQQAYSVTTDGYYWSKLHFSEDGSKLFWDERYDRHANKDGVFYFPDISQLSMPTASGGKIDKFGSGVVSVGDTVYLNFDLIAIYKEFDQHKITLSLNTGGTAIYNADLSTPGKSYVFTYTVKPDDYATDLSIKSINLNGAQLLSADGKSALISKELEIIKGNLKINGYDGTVGDENFLGTEGAEIFSGREGNDIYRINNAGDRIVEKVGAGYDTVIATIGYKLAAGLSIEVLRVARSAQYANVNLTGNEFVQTIEGKSGDNILDGGGGADILIGFGGNDTYIVDTPKDQVIEARGAGNDTIVAACSYVLETGQEIETLRLAPKTGTQAFNLVGNEFAQTLVGNYGNNTLDGGGGADVMTGGAGNDTYFVDSSADRVIEGRKGGTDRVYASTSYTLVAGQEIESLQLASAKGSARLNLTGNEFAQTLTGNAGANVLDGKQGADTLIGARGDDTYVVDQAGDLVVEAKGGGQDTVIATATWALAAGQEVETIRLVAGSTKMNLTGNEFAQTLVGNAGANVLDGKGGADTLDGRGGNDTYIVDSASDVVREAKGGGTDTLITTVSYSLAEGQEVEVVRLNASTEQRNLDLRGNEFGQALKGNLGANVLDGRGGADVLTGGRGVDAFVFSTALGTGNVDRITDFAPVDDTIRLAESIFSALDAGPLGKAAFKNISAGSVDADDRILYKQTTGELFYDADGSGKAAAMKFAVLDNHAKLTHDDFFVI